jgi:hypothetical protein
MAGGSNIFLEVYLRVNEFDNNKDIDSCPFGVLLFISYP